MIFAPTQRLEYQQDLPLTKEQSWDFFSRPENLARITPENLNFEVISPLPEKMYAGMMVSYRVRPLFGFAMRWTSEITHVREPNFFVDEQRSGPYRIWHHEHLFEPIEGGVRVIDRVHYQLPCGMPAYWLLNQTVRSRLEEIFSYRRRKLIELFGTLETS